MSELVKLDEKRFRYAKPENDEQKEVVYEVIETARMKHPVSREWVFCVCYQNPREKQLGTFVRELNDFMTKFKPEDSDDIPF